MTLAEAVWKAESWKLNQNLEWDRARRIIAATENAGLVARGGKITSSMLSQPEQIKQLPWDKKQSLLTEEEIARPQELYDLAEKCGIITSKKKSLKEIFNVPKEAS